MKWSGLNRRTSELDPEMGHPFNLESARLSVDGELRRRPGMAAGSWSPVTGVPIAMAVAYPPTGGPAIVIQQANGNIDGITGGHPLWTDTFTQPPDIFVGSGPVTCWPYSKSQTFGPAAIGVTNDVTITLPASVCAGTCSFNITPNTYGGKIECFCDGVQTATFPNVTGNQSLLGSVIANATHVIARFTVLQSDPAGQCIITIHQP